MRVSVTCCCSITCPLLPLDCRGEKEHSLYLQTSLEARHFILPWWASPLGLVHQGQLVETQYLHPSVAHTVQPRHLAGADPWMNQPSTESVLVHAPEQLWEGCSIPLVGNCRCKHTKTTYKQIFVKTLGLMTLIRSLRKSFWATFTCRRIPQFLTVVSKTVKVRLMMWKFLELPVNRFLKAATASLGLH